MEPGCSSTSGGLTIPAVEVGSLLEDQFQQAGKADFQVIAAQPAHAADAHVVLMDHASLTQHSKMACPGRLCHWQGKVGARYVHAAASQLNDDPQPHRVSHGRHQAEQVQFTDVRVREGVGSSAGHVPSLSLKAPMFTLTRT